MRALLLQNILRVRPEDRRMYEEEEGILKAILE